MAKDISDAVREVCLSFPETEEIPSRGSPDFRVRGKTFATYVINHHGDGHVALWLRAPLGDQSLYVELDPDNYFVPPYVGPKGWLGVDLGRGLDWATIAQRVREAYEYVAPDDLSLILGPTIKIKGKISDLKPEEIDPFVGKRPKQIIPKFDKLLCRFPEVSQSKQFGSLVWKAGKKTFAWANCYDRNLKLQFWVGLEQQPILTIDKRYSVPAYMGHNGWINLDVSKDIDWKEAENLALNSYKHFALKRMLKALEES